MTSIIRLTCLSGGLDSAPSCYLLQIDQFRCLLDCGWDEKFSLSIVEEISKHFKTLNAILLTYPDPSHLGALPYLVKHFGVPCPIYATRPVTQMGQMFMTDLLLSRLNNQEFDLYSMDDVKKAFENDKIVHLNYNQTFHLEGSGCGLSLTPLLAGHMVGGTLWKIMKDEEDIVYAVDYNHKKERHLNGCVLDTITRPSLLITDAYNALNHQSRMRERDQRFLSTIIETLRGGGNILIACDTAGRVLEIAHMLDNFWRRRDNGVSAYSLALVNNVAGRMIDITMSTIEWMSENILREFETSRDNPFKFKHLQLKQQLSDLEYLPQPMTVLASQPDLESGFAKDLFAIWSRDPKNSIIFTQRPGVGTFGYQVLNTPSRVVQVEIWQRIELVGEELEEYKKKEEERKQQELIESQKKLAIHDSDSDVDSIEENRVSRSSKALAHHHQPSKHDLMMMDELERGTVFFKQARKTYPMFPAPLDCKIKFDDYGEEIDPQDYVMIHRMQGSNKLIDIDGETNEIQAVKETENSDEIEEEAEIRPTKCVSIVATLNVQAALHIFDFEGRSDGESVKNLVSQVKPRRLILVRGSPESTAFMADYCRAFVDEKILVPQTGETVDATTENYIYQVKLKDSLVSSLNFHTANDGVELAWVDAKTQVPVDEDELVSDKLPYLESIEPDQLPLHNALFINELKLSDFKQILINNGVQAEFSGGVLYCNEKITVRRRESGGGRGRIHIEGTLCDDYFKVRDLLYQQYIVI